MTTTTVGPLALPRTQRLAAVLQQHRVYRDVFEILLVALAFLLYFIVRGAVVNRQDDALANANSIIDFTEG